MLSLIIIIDESHQFIVVMNPSYCSSLTSSTSDLSRMSTMDAWRIGSRDYWGSGNHCPWSSHGHHVDVGSHTVEHVISWNDTACSWPYQYGQTVNHCMAEGWGNALWTLRTAYPLPPTIFLIMRARSSLMDLICAFPYITQVNSSNVLYNSSWTSQADSKSWNTFWNLGYCWSFFRGELSPCLWMQYYNRLLWIHISPSALLHNHYIETWIVLWH